jgi:hypothetical protein
MVRIHTYLTMATPLLWMRTADIVGALGLALNAAAERDGNAEVCERISELLSCASDIWKEAPEIVDDDRRIDAHRKAFQLIHLADIESLTAHA